MAENRFTISNTITKDRAKSFARYAMMPGIVPRIRALGMHFGHFAYLLALVFNSARLIPNNHPVLNAANIGHYGVRQVMALAANNIRWSRNNVDQIAIFSAVVIGVIMIAIQAVLIALYAFSGTAHAQTPSADSFFTTPNENVRTDVVLIFLDQVFGSNLELFGTAAQPIGTSVHLGLQKILGLYSMATMVIAVIIVLYYILTVVGEAAQSGTPFGRRFNSLWAPVRLVVALGLLVPLSTGLNSAQYLTLWTAKMGSGLATQVWIQFTSGIMETQNIISKPVAHGTISLVQRIFLSEVCAAAYNQVEQQNGKKIEILQVLGNRSQAATFSSPQAMIFHAKQAGMKDVIVSWSNRREGENATDYSCGFISVSLADFDLYKDNTLVSENERTGTGFWNWVFGGHDLADRIGSIHSDIRDAYLSEIGKIAEAVRPEAEKMAAYSISINKKPAHGDRSQLASIPAALEAAARSAHTNINVKIEASYESMTNSSMTKGEIYDEMVKRGWGAAGLWYGNIGKINQKYMDAINSSIPSIGNITHAEDINTSDRSAAVSWIRSIFGVSRFNTSGEATREIESAINIASDEYSGSFVSAVSPNDPMYADVRMQNSQYSSSENELADWMLWLLGASQLYDLKNNPQLDPMSRLMGGGSSIIDRAFVSLGAGAVLSVGGSAMGKAQHPAKKFGGDLAKAVGAFFMSLAMIGLVAGIFLFYVVPIIPFVYFCFAIIGWVLEIFEAIVAMPLWALAHLRIDGDGMPGGAAIIGYQLLLMILLRPALIVFGLIGGYVIFGAAVYFFSSLFNSATSVLHHDIANNTLGAMGVFVYTIIFTFLVYNIAIMCFKMIDDVPKGMLRWLGANAQPFGDSRGDPINGTREMVIASVAGGQQIASGLEKAKAKYEKRGIEEGQARRHRELVQAVSGGGGAAARASGAGTGQPGSAGGGQPVRANNQTGGFDRSGFRERSDKAKANIPRKKDT